MCGIAGYRTFRPLPASVLEAMVESLYHRGPDSAGYYRTVHYNAGMRRLSINDLVTGEQPLFNEDRSIVLLYNGEIYNYPQLRRELEDAGHQLGTRSDGEVICHLYEQYGEDLFERLDGMFAAALWIEPEQKLVLARDIPGEKPLYYALLSETEVVFASEIRSLVLFPGLDLSLDEQALWDFPTFLWIPEPATIYKSIRALPPGHLLVLDRERLRLRSYADKFRQRQFQLEDDDSVIRTTRSVVTQAVQSRLLSDVPVGCFLSSGLDSSIVATIAAEALPHLTTFTIGFEDLADPYHGFADESKYADEYARILGTRHHTVRITAEDFERDLLLFCIHGDQPFSVSSGLGILAVARAAHENGVKVLLSGDGADECFGGYSWYFHLDLPDNGHSGSFQGCPRVSFQNTGIKLADRLGILSTYSPQQRAWAWHYYASEPEKLLLFNQERFEAVQSSLRFFFDYRADSHWAPEDYVKQDRLFYFVNEMLRKVDRMTMAFSVEGRVPFAAPAVQAFADNLRFSHMVRGDSLKWVLRRAFAPVLPESVYTRPKHGFNVPIDHWLKNEWAYMVEEAFSPDSQLMKLGLIHNKSRDVAIAMVHDPHRLNGHAVFSCVMLNLWLENVYGNHR